MQAIDTPTHRCKMMLDNGEMYIYQFKEKTIKVIRITSEGITSKETPISELPVLRPIMDTPLFSANYAGAGMYNVDMDCGAQRWNGQKTGRDMGFALRVCGFDNKQIRTILTAARKFTNKYIGRHY